MGKRKEIIERECKRVYEVLKQKALTKEEIREMINGCPVTVNNFLVYLSVNYPIYTLKKNQYKALTDEDLGENEWRQMKCYGENYQ